MSSAALNLAWADAIATEVMEAAFRGRGAERHLKRADVKALVLVALERAAATELLAVAESVAAKRSGCENCQECRAGDIWWDAREAVAKARAMPSAPPDESAQESR